MHTDYRIARTHMVQSQIYPNRVTNPALLDAFMQIKREDFLPDPLKPFAYLDDDLFLKEGRVLLEPLLLARLLQAADIQPNHIVLDIGCTTGYSTAIIAQLAQTVIGLECTKNLVTDANHFLETANIDNAVVLEGPLEKGCPDHGPYHSIILNGAVSEIPSILTAQLAQNGSLLACLESDQKQEVVLVKRQGKKYTSHVLFESKTTLLPGFKKKEEFQF